MNNIQLKQDIEKINLNLAQQIEMTTQKESEI